MSRRVATIVMAGLVAALLVPGAASAAPSREQPCGEAWTTIATERAALESNDPASWARVSDAFISLSDSSFDGPLSNALGYVSTAASDYAGTLQADSEADPSRVAFDSTLAALGTVCARLSVATHRATVPRFTTFSYQAGSLTGLSAEATTVANAAIARTVNAGVREAKRTNASRCPTGGRACAYYVQTLVQRACRPGYVCVRLTSGLLASGANSGLDWVDTFAFDGRTGRPATLAQVIPSDQRASFLSGVNAAVERTLAADGLANDPFWKAKVTWEDVRAWLPQPDGIHVWFDKYAVAPGSFGIVHVVVPWPTVPPTP